MLQITQQTDFGRIACLLYLLSNRIVYRITHIFKRRIHITIGKPQYFQAVFLQHVCPLLIVCKGIMLAVLLAVQFDHQSGRRAIEINDVSVDRPLTIEPDRISLQEIVPKVLFLFCHFSTQALCFSLICAVVASIEAVLIAPGDSPSAS